MPELLLPPHPTADTEVPAAIELRGLTKSYGPKGT